VAGFEVRPLSREERIAIVKGELQFGMPHRVHVAGLLRDHGEFFDPDEAARLRSELVKLDEPQVMEALAGAFTRPVRSGRVPPAANPD
jgi:hypothetical protein